MVWSRTSSDWLEMGQSKAWPVLALWYALALIVMMLCIVGNANAASFQGAVSAGDQKWHSVRAVVTGTHNFSLRWALNSANLDLAVDRKTGERITLLSGSTPGNNRESVAIWLAKGDEVTLKAFGRAGNSVAYTIDATDGQSTSNDGTGTSPGNTGTAGGSSLTYNSALSGGQQRWHYFSASASGEFNLKLTWWQTGANADLLLTDLQGRVLQTAAFSGGTTRNELMRRGLTAGQEFYAKVLMRQGSNASYQLQITPPSNTSNTGGTGSSGGTTVVSPPASATGVPWYMDDANRGTVREGPLTQSLGYPRVMLAETQSLRPPHARYTKYPIIAAQASNIPAVRNVQASRPTPYLRMFTPRVTLEDRFSWRDACTQGLGIPFGSSTASTGNCGVWAGHWLYTRTSRLASAMSANAGQITVQNASGFKVGEYVAIYNGGIKQFLSAEHARINGISGNTLSLSGRFKSTSRYRNAGAYVRQHARAGNSNTAFVFNLATTSPRDPNGRTIVEFMTDWLAANLKIDVDGRWNNVEVSGLTFDVDTYLDVFNLDGDVNNDGIADGGTSPSGEQWWGEGVENFYQRLRQRFPNFVIVGGHQQSFGHRWLNGTQIEGFPNGPLYKSLDDWGELTGMMSVYLHRMAASPYGPAMVQNVMKHGTWLYPTNGQSRFGLKPVRLGLALTAMDGGFFTHENTYNHPDTWYDEYSVHTDRGSSNYGQATDKSNAWVTRDNTGWLGTPTGPFRRLDPAGKFVPGKALATATFESNTNGFSGNNVSVYRSTTDKKDGSAALGVSRMQGYSKNRWAASVNGPSINVQSGRDYTVVFSARASSERWIQLRLANYGDDIPVGPTWRRYVVPFRSTQSGLRQLRFQLGLLNTEFFLDSVMVFEGDANVFRRDFQRGSVIANATPNAVTVVLGDGYRRIRGTQDSATNNGANLPATVTIPARDALFALKR